MKTVQMTLDEELVEAVDEAAKRLGTTRSGFALGGLCGRRFLACGSASWSSSIVAATNGTQFGPRSSRSGRASRYGPTKAR